MRPAARRAAALLAGVAVVATLTAGCGGDDQPPASLTTSTAATSAGAALPPADEPGLRAVFDPVLEPLGLRLTRASLVDTASGYERSETGRHLALYVEPIQPDRWTVDDTVATIAPLAAAVVPLSFGRWSGLDSFDVCQEPPGDDRAEPPAVTQLQLSRADAGLIDWRAVTLADLLAAAVTSPQTAHLTAADEVQAHPAFQAAVATAGRAVSP